MKRAEAMRRLQEHEPELRQLGVERLFLFGSTARDEAGRESDVDLFFDHEPGKLGFFELIEVQHRVAEILGEPADVMTRDSLHPLLRKRIEDSAVAVFS